MVRQKSGVKRRKQGSGNFFKEVDTSDRHPGVTLLPLLLHPSFPLPLSVFLSVATWLSGP